jgi:tetratricopeptide (TPR) repeat protein
VLWRVFVASFIFIVCLNAALAQSSLVNPQEKALRDKLAKVEKQFGRYRIETFKSRSSLSTYFSQVKKYKDAIPLYQQQLKIIDKYFSALPPQYKPHSHVVSINFWLAMAYQKTGDYDKAIYHYLRILELQEKYAYSEGLDPSMILEELGNLYRTKERYVDAIKIYQRLLVIEERAGETAELADTLAQLGLMNELNGGYNEALPYYERRWSIYEKVKGHDNIDVAMTLGSIGRIQGRMDKGLDAYNSLQSALSILEKLGLAESQGAATVINNLAMLNLHAGDYENAITLFQRSLTISEKAGDKSMIATNLANLSEVYREQGRFDQALPFAKGSLENLETTDSKSSDRATVMNNLGLIFQAQGNYAEALIYFQKSLILLESNLGKNYPEVATPLNNLSVLYDTLNDIPKALIFAERSLAICEKTFGYDHRITAGVLNSVAALNGKRSTNSNLVA